jgi:hypothetical protein
MAGSLPFSLRPIGWQQVPLAARLQLVSALDSQAVTYAPRYPEVPPDVNQRSKGEATVARCCSGLLSVRMSRLRLACTCI